jgi:hypothetical protein
MTVDPVIYSGTTDLANRFVFLSQSFYDEECAQDASIAIGIRFTIRGD